MDNNSRYGIGRVISPKGVLPQAATRLDNNMVISDDEILVDVKTLNIDSASFTQIAEVCHNNLQAIGDMVLSIVKERGKMQNPVTGSGGMFLGKVNQVGKALDIDLKPGDEIASLVSLSLTPLRIDRIKSIHPEKDQIDIEGQAILFASGIYAKIPNDLPSSLVLAALDVAGAPAQTAKLVKKGDTVLVIGASGKSGLLVSYQAKKSAGPEGKVIGIINDIRQLEDLQSINACDEIIKGDATNPLEIYEKVLSANGNEKVDVTINVVNVPNTEMTSILPTKDDGTVYFFSMATSFAKAALGAEGIACEATMIIGNGYTAGHADLTMDLFRESRTLYDIFMQRYGSGE
ncbi:MAG TPA: L-erythro-3,5-diaminohexanoate dehydrogenase [Bacillota bacterium]|nr:L-erythro-3,5-diaminohexanoate dehydrogenase [Bacillota bacterium]HRX91451.1 L-erythro-3,5-diaminohexanoate dehydrogenase [Candidatus Izemoplasmatales bacterium]